jgi:hypothetical protein
MFQGLNDAIKDKLFNFYLQRKSFEIKLFLSDGLASDACGLVA